jgi:pSer/pThr/pTyr-binding forkhead associated (FHA) protein
MRSWIIGSGTGCDVVVDSPVVSGRHCELSEATDGYRLEDLGSTNGTYVNGVRITTRCRVSRQDAITLGLTIQMPWPAEPAARGKVVYRIGREPDNDYVINLPMVSGHHAQITWEGAVGKAVIEDLGSSNGTALNSPDQKITRAPLTAADTIYLGSHAIPAAQILVRIDRSFVVPLTFRGDFLTVGRDAACDCVVDQPMISGRHAQLVRRNNQVFVMDLGSSNGTFVNGQRIFGETLVRDGELIGLGSHTLLLVVEPPAATKPVAPVTAPAAPSIPPISTVAVSQPADVGSALVRELGDALKPPWRLPALLIQAPLLAILIALILRATPAAPGDPAGTTAAAEAIVSILFWISLAAIWFGLSNALLANLLDRARIERGLSPEGAGGLIARLFALLALGALECVLAWFFAAAIAGLKAPAGQALVLLTLASAVGLAVGLLIVSLAPGRQIAWGLVALTVVLLWVCGSPLARLWKSPVWIIANALPARWTFEGLLLLESDNEAPVDSPDPSVKAPADLAEPYFAAASERMGPRADAMALTFMFIGLAAGAVFISGTSKPSP